MGALIGTYCIAGLFLLTPLLTSRLQERRVDEADAQGLRDLRTFAESNWTNYLLGIWSLLSFVGGLFLLLRGRSIGWGWLGAALVYALAIVVARRQRLRLRRSLGDRGAIELPARYRTGVVRSYRYAAAGATGYVGIKIVGYAYPRDTPPAASVFIGLFALVLVVGVVGFATIRIRMWLKGEDLATEDS